MKNNKTLKIIIITLLFLIILAIVGVIYFNKMNDINDEKNIIYEISFFDGGEPGTNRDIKIYKDKVKINITHACSAVDCQSTKEEKTQNFSKENIDKLKNFIETNFSEKLNGNKVVIYGTWQLNLYQKGVIYSLEGGESNFEINVEEYKYKIEYHENDNLDYFIYFKNDNSILVKKVLNNKITTYKVNFSEENMNRLNNYIEKMIEPEPDFPIIWRYSKKCNISDELFKRYGVSEEEMYIINSIIENNESILDNLN